MALFGSLLGSSLAKAGSNVLTQVKSSSVASASLVDSVKPFTTDASFRSTQQMLGGIGPLDTTEENYVDELVVMGNREKPKTDLRVRLSAQPNQADMIYGEKDEQANILSMLHDTGGLLFPYTPTISVDQTVDYKTVDLVHSNYDINTYTRTPSVSLSVTGKFTVQNQAEGRYSLAVLHFLRTVSKMYFGELDKNGPNGDLAGMPPPVLIFSGYGTYMFNDLRVVVKGHSYTFDDTVDMVDVITPDGLKTRLPALFTVSIVLGVQQTPTAMRKGFSLDAFRTGELMRRGGGWI